MQEYRESILLELRETSVLAANMFAQAKVRYEEENVVCLELLDTIVSEGRKEEILSLLEGLFTERFHIPADIRVTYRESEGAGTMSRGYSRRSTPYLSEGPDSGARSGHGPAQGNSFQGMARRMREGWKQRECQQAEHPAARLPQQALPETALVLRGTEQVMARVLWGTEQAMAQVMTWVLAQTPHLVPRRAHPQTAGQKAAALAAPERKKERKGSARADLRKKISTARSRWGTIRT